MSILQWLKSNSSCDSESGTSSSVSSKPEQSVLQVTCGSTGDVNITRVQQQTSCVPERSSAPLIRAEGQLELSFSDSKVKIWGGFSPPLAYTLAESGGLVVIPSISAMNCTSVQRGPLTSGLCLTAVGLLSSLCTVKLGFCHLHY